MRCEQVYIRRQVAQNTLHFERKPINLYQFRLCLEYVVKDFKDKVAVVTGSASGIGRGIAEHCVQEGMKVVLADIDQDGLDTVVGELKAKDASVLAVQTDVADASAMEALAQQTIDEFGAVHLLFNNAGVTGGNVATSTLAEWEWVFGINVWGVIHGVHFFIPIMTAQNTEAHIINTASLAGLISFEGIYGVSKHTVVALSEALHHDLTTANSKIKVSVLCPSVVNTNIGTNRHRPPELQNESNDTVISPEQEQMQQKIRDKFAAGMSPKQVANHVFKSIENEDFYILTHPEFNSLIQMRTDDILQGNHPKSTVLAAFGLE